MINHTTYHLPEEVLEGLDAAERRSLADVWTLCGEVAPVIPQSDKEALRVLILSQAVQPKVGVQDRPILRPIRPTARIHQFRMQMVSVAAALVVGVSVLFSGGAQYHAAPHGERSLEITLDDGSVVQLAAGSRLSIPDGFGVDHRAVVLHGEAFFDVAKASAPFTVRTPDSRTTVLGTSFNVRSWPGALHTLTEVIVASGRVAVESTEARTIVEPGQSVTVTKDTLLPVDTDPQSRLAWLEGGFSYENELIGNILDDVERRFDIRVKAPASIRLRPITIHRNQVDQASEFLGDIAATVSVRYRPTAIGFELYLD
ncbi:MAG: FecR domain-containing protein [Bacteroidetes bacterium]|nr:FecR domain-containing protein [Bacteroidota bacterium]